MLVSQELASGIRKRCDHWGGFFGFKGTASIESEPQGMTTAAGYFARGWRMTGVAGELLFRPYFLRISLPATILR